MTHVLDTALARRSNLVRKGIAYSLQASRTIRRLADAKPDFARHPPVIVNSIPKSGTHLLMQIARALPGTCYFGSFIAQNPSISLRLRSQSDVDRLISRIVTGEVVGAHLYHTPATSSAFEQRNALNLFIFRDPRDVVVSSLFYLRDVVTWNAVSKAIRALPSDESRLTALVNGIPEIAFPPLSQRLGSYAGWVDDPNALAIRFEDARQAPGETIERILLAFERRSGTILTDEQRALLYRSPNASGSHTFRKGAVGGWRDHFTPAVALATADEMEPILERLGYA